MAISWWWFRLRILLLKPLYRLLGLVSRHYRLRYWQLDLDSARSKRLWFEKQLQFRSSLMNRKKQDPVTAGEREHSEALEELLPEQEFYYAPLDWDKLTAEGRRELMELERVLPNRSEEDLQWKFPVDGRNDRLVFGAFMKAGDEEPLLIAEVYAVFFRGYPDGDIQNWLYTTHDARDADTAIFYSISSSPRFAKLKIGGVGVGTHLILAAKRHIATTHPNIVNYLTWSPLTGLREYILRMLEEQPERSATLRLVRWRVLELFYEQTIAPGDRVAFLRNLFSGELLYKEESWLRYYEPCFALRRFLLYWGRNYLYLDEQMSEAEQHKVLIGRRGFVQRFHKLINHALSFGYLNFPGNSRDLSSCGMTTSYIYHLENIEKFNKWIYRQIPVDRMCAALAPYMPWPVIFRMVAGLTDKHWRKTTPFLKRRGRSAAQQRAQLFTATVLQDNTRPLHGSAFGAELERFVYDRYKVRLPLLLKQKK